MLRMHPSLPVTRPYGLTIFSLLFGVAMVCLLPDSLRGESAGSVRAIHRSDVVFMYDNPDRYADYGCTVLGWAGSSNPQRVEQAHQAGVRLYASSIGFLTEFRRVIDFSPDFLDAACRNFAGEPFVVPWLWDHKYKDQPAWWWCTNSPLYREYLHSRLEEVVASGADGLHIDDYAGTSGAVTWLSACFCEHCMAGFREYLKQNLSEEKCRQLGIDNLDAFDYREFLLDQGVTADDYNRRRASLPLAAEFLDFQVKADIRFVAEFHREACRMRGQEMTLAVNSGLSAPMRLAVAPHLSYFCCEVGHNAASLQVPRHPVYIYKLADGLGKPVTSTASGHDWAFINEESRPALVRTWIALSYAFGHTLMAPHRQWCYTQEKGTHWYDGPTEEYAYVYRFIREHAGLFDGYEAIAPVAVVYSNPAARAGKGNIEPICGELAWANTPFTVEVAGDDWLPGYRLTEASLADYRAVVVPGDLLLDDAQQKVIDAVREDGRLVVWSDGKRLAELIAQPVRVDGTDQVLAVPRAHPDTDRPLVLHLLNRAYQGDSDTMEPVGNFTVSLDASLLPRPLDDYTKAVLHAPKRDPVELEVITDESRLRVDVPKLVAWGIVELVAGR